MFPVYDYFSHYLTNLLPYVKNTAVTSLASVLSLSISCSCETHFLFCLAAISSRGVEPHLISNPATLNLDSNRLN